MKKKKLLSLVVLFAVTSSFIFLGNPVNASASTNAIQSNVLNQQNAPHYFQVKDVIVMNGGQRYYFHTVSAYGTYYRGWLGLQKSYNGIDVYSGHVYRSDLPYPLPG